MIGEHAAPPHHVIALPVNDCVITVTTHHPVVSATSVNLVVSVNHHLVEHSQVCGVGFADIAPHIFVRRFRQHSRGRIERRSAVVAVCGAPAPGAPKLSLFPLS